MELQLISASSAAGEPADCKLIYRLDEGSSRGLPVVNETHPWAGKSICALRDRLMIEWVLSFPESKRLFKRMVDEINSAIIKTSTSESKSKSKAKVDIIRVGIVCSNGTQLSPSFVEKLYEHFSSVPTAVEGLKVSRKHWDALKREWGRCKNIVWQVSRMTVHHKIESHFKRVFDSRMWLNFDPTANTATEQQFQKDPFNSRIEFTDMVLDLESGTAYSSERRKTYYIRCSIIQQSRANCWFLTSDGYKSARRSFQAAGIQPYSVHPVTGEAVFLLGRITYGTCDWCDFGGLKSFRLFREHPRLTAARECYEETLGILGTSEELAAALSDFKTNNCFKILNVDTQYVEHFMRITYSDYPNIFEMVLMKTDEVHIEVDVMKWFPLSSLKNAVMMANSDQYGITQHSIKIKAVDKDGTVDHSCSYPLRSPYISTLCVADGLGILDSIAAIAKSVHREEMARDSAVLHASVLEPREVNHEQDEGKSNIDSEPTSAEHKNSASCTSVANNVEKDLIPQVNKTTCEDSENKEEAKNEAVSCTSVAEVSTASEQSTSNVHTTSDYYQSESDSDSYSSGTDSEFEDERSTDDDLDEQVPRNSVSEEGMGAPEENTTEKTSSDDCIQDKDVQEASSKTSTFHIKSKLLNLLSSKNVKSRQKKKRNRHQRLEGHKNSQPKFSKRKRDKQLLLYGMGAGSFSTAMESYMNS